jgi:hypothetical protein
MSVVDISYRLPATGRDRHAIPGSRYRRLRQGDPGRPDPTHGHVAAIQRARGRASACRRVCRSRQHLGIFENRPLRPEDHRRTKGLRLKEDPHRHRRRRDYRKTIYDGSAYRLVLVGAKIQLHEDPASREWALG